MNLSKEEIQNKLKQSVVELEFIKLNGEKRNMRCTLMESHLPPAKADDSISQKKVRSVSMEVLCVWDVEKSAWRSMRWDRIQDVK